ncbi:MAG: hypothetical protein RJB01_1791 [Actinomycetota bacterium]|jgi:hypothetical protein
MSAPVTPLSPTTGEPINVISRRATVGLWTLIVMSVSGQLALVVSYTYLWSLNVNGGWAPPGASLTAKETNSTIPSKLTGTFAAEWPFWAILGLVIVATIAMWFGYKELVRGHHAGMLLGGTVSLLVSIAALVAQWIQISTFPFDATDGAYASAVLLLCASNIVNLLLVVFLVLGLVNRTRKGLITPLVYYQSKLVSYWMVWVCIAFLMGAVLTTFLVESPNVDPSTFGTFSQKS